MKNLVEQLLNDKRKKRPRGKLADALGISYTGLQHKMTFDTFNEDDIPILENFFEVEPGYFTNAGNKPEMKNIDSSILEMFKQQYDKRIEELTAALQDARYTIQLQKRLMGESSNFNGLSKRPPVRVMKMAGMYISTPRLRFTA